MAIQKDISGTMHILRIYALLESWLYKPVSTKKGDVTSWTFPPVVYRSRDNGFVDLRDAVGSE